MEKDQKDKLVDGAEAKMRTTFHSKDGRFSSAMAATSANRGGERLKVVRQLRRLTRSKPGSKQEENDRVLRTVLRMNLAKTKAAMSGALSAPGFILVGDLF